MKAWAFLLLFWTGLYISAEESAADILLKARVFSGKVDFTAQTEDNRNGIKSIKRYFAKTAPDGGRFYRIEVILANGNKMVTIRNESGEYSIIGDNAIKTSEFSNRKLRLSENSMPPKKRYSITEAKWMTIPCFMIMEEILEGDLKGKTIYHIGRTDYFIYSKRSYDSNGVLRSSLEYTNVELNAKIEDDIFHLPANVKVKIPQTRKDEAEQLSKAIMPPVEKKKQHGYRWENVLDDMLSSKVEYFLIAISMILLMIITINKLKKGRR